MQPDRLLLILAGFWSVVDLVLCSPKDEQAHRLLTKSLEKEILRHTIQFLRHKLVTCLRENEALRIKRKAHFRNSISDTMVLELDVDIAVLRHTKQFLIDRLLDCYVANSEESPDRSPYNTDLFPDHLNHDESREMARYPWEGAPGSGGRAKLGLGDDLDMGLGAGLRPDVTRERPRLGHSETRYPKNQRKPDISIDVESPTPFKVENSNRQPTEQRVAPTQYKATVGQGRPRLPIMKSFESDPSTAAPPTVSVPRSDTGAAERQEALYYFAIQGRNITCQSVRMLNGGKSMQCRNLWVDGHLRLPNRHVCPSHYQSNDWRDLVSLERRTFKVFDVTNFCSAIGDVIPMNGYVVNARVVWGCDANMERLSWKFGNWAGTVMDNGFLHDLECTYSSPVFGFAP